MGGLRWRGNALVEDPIRGWTHGWVNRWTERYIHGPRAEERKERCPSLPSIPPTAHLLAFLTSVNCVWSLLSGPRVGIWWLETFLRLFWKLDDWHLGDKQASPGLSGQGPPPGAHQWRPCPPPWVTDTHRRSGRKEWLGHEGACPHQCSDTSL